MVTTLRPAAADGIGTGLHEFESGTRTAPGGLLVGPQDMALFLVETSYTSNE